MKASLKTFKSGKGDCIFFLIDDDGRRFVTMIDCGKYTPEIKKHVEEVLGKYINILIVTHIDNDHLDGIVEMLEQTPDIKIGKILYNCNQLWKGSFNKQTSESLEQDLQVLRGNLPSRQTIDNGKIKADKAITLAEILAQKEEWWNAWKKDEYITTETPPIALDEEDERFGALTVISPNKTDIESLNTLFRVEYSRLTKHILEEGGHLEGQEALFEMVERLTAMKRDNYKKFDFVKTGVTSISFDEKYLTEAYKFEPQGVTDENGASIALIWQYGDKRVLFLGDADPDKLVEQINSEEEHEFEAIKVSHHGSKHSTTLKLMRRVDSRHYFFTGGNLKDKPSLEAIIKIVGKGDNQRRVLHFNNTENIIVKTLLSKQGATVREKYNFEVSVINEHQFEY